MENNENEYENMTDTSGEYATESAEEFGAIPEEMTSPGFAPEYGIRNGATDLSGLYDDPVDEYDTEAAGESYVSNEETSPEDETAAVDGYDCGCGCNDDCRRCELDDYEIISDVLGGEKQLVKLYSTALCESAEESLRDVIRDNLIECASDQYAAYDFMEKRGMYPTEQAPADKVSKAKDQFSPLT